MMFRFDFVVIHEQRQLSLDGFSNATTLLSLSFLSRNSCQIRKSLITAYTANFVCCVRTVYFQSVERGGRYGRFSAMHFADRWTRLSVLQIAHRVRTRIRLLA